MELQVCDYYAIQSEVIQADPLVGISIETQILRLLVFVSRYLDVYFRAPISPYNTTLKWTILASSLILVSTLIGDKIRTGYGQVEKCV